MHETVRNIVCERTMLAQEGIKGGMTGLAERYIEKYIEKLVLM